ncbi:hypothetical protein Dimus_010647, partial [Dionaea muscipula]
IFSVSLRQQLQDVGKKLVSAQHYNKDGSINDRHHSRFALSHRLLQFRSSPH